MNRAIAQQCTRGATRRDCVGWLTHLGLSKILKKRKATMVLVQPPLCAQRMWHGPGLGADQCTCRGKAVVKGTPTPALAHKTTPVNGCCCPTRPCCPPHRPRSRGKATPGAASCPPSPLHRPRGRGPGSGWRSIASTPCSPPPGTCGRSSAAAHRCGHPPCCGMAARPRRGTCTRTPCARGRGCPVAVTGRRRSRCCYPAPAYHRRAQRMSGHLAAALIQGLHDAVAAAAAAK